MLTFTEYLLQEKYDFATRQGYDMLVVNKDLKITWNLLMLDDGFIHIEHEGKLKKVSFKNENILDKLYKLTGIKIDKTDAGIIKLLNKLPAKEETAALK